VTPDEMDDDARLAGDSGSDEPGLPRLDAYPAQYGQADDDGWASDEAATPGPEQAFGVSDLPATEPVMVATELVMVATELPATELPATEPPATEPPATEPPATEPPATELLATVPVATHREGASPQAGPAPQAAPESRPPGSLAAAAEGLSACTNAHQALLQRLGGLDEATARRPSLLPGWTIGHVVTHLARNADSIARWIEGALAGTAVARYPGGREQRDYDIQLGARRPAPELLEDLWRSCARLEQVWARAALAGWPDVDPPPSDAPWPTTESPWRRLVEVEIHHADLGLGYHAGEWSDALVNWMLPARLQRLDVQITDPAQRRRLLTWLVGRSDSPSIGRLGGI
jgi:maleylpyruvate isomerase